jgi:glycosyltransferase involved in cell wall biosynthesis
MVLSKDYSFFNGLINQDDETMKIAFLGPFINSYLKPFLPNLSDDDLIKSPGMGGNGLIELVEERLLRRNKTIVITLDTNLESDTIIRKGEYCSLYSLPKRRGYKSLFDLFSRERKSIAHAIEDSKPDLIHAHWTTEYALTVLNSKIPTVITSHDHPKDVLKYLGWRFFPSYLISNHIIKKAKYITTVSPYVLDYINKLRTNNDAVCIGNPLASKFINNSDWLNKDYSYISPVITSVLDWNELKNPKNALLGFNILLDKFPNAELHLFGHGLGKGEVGEYWCQENGLLRNIHFNGRVHNETVKEQMKKTTILLYTSRNESFGMVVAEAMVLGLPIIGGQESGAIPYLLDYGKAGLLTDINDPKAIASALLLLLSDVGKRSDFGQKAGQRAQVIFDPDMIVEKWDTIYERVLMGKMLSTQGELEI